MEALVIVGVVVVGIIALRIGLAALESLGERLWRSSGARRLLGVVALIGGAVLLPMGIARVLDPPERSTPTCGSHEMTRDQVCDTYSSRSGHVRTADYDGQRDQNRRDARIPGYLMLGGGVLLLTVGRRAFKRQQAPDGAVATGGATASAGATEATPPSSAATQTSDPAPTLTPVPAPEPALTLTPVPAPAPAEPVLRPVGPRSVPPAPPVPPAPIRPVVDEATRPVRNAVVDAATQRIPVAPTASAPPRPPALTFDATGLQPAGAGWADPRVGAVFRVDDVAGAACPVPLERFGEVRRWLAEQQSATGCLVEAHPVTVVGLPAMCFITKTPDRRPGAQPVSGKTAPLVYRAAFVIPRAGRFVQLNGIFPEQGITGTRDATVAEEIMLADGVASDRFSAVYPPHPYAPALKSALPYSHADDRRYDPRFPDHPLSRARTWLNRVLPTIRVAPEFAALPPFTG